MKKIAIFAITLVLALLLAGSAAVAGTNVVLCPDNYKWEHYCWDSCQKIFTGRQYVHFINSGTDDAYNVTAMVSWTPVNVEATAPYVTLGDIPAGGGAWSTDTFELRVDMTNQQDPHSTIMWTVEYDDSLGIHHILVDVPMFCGEPPGPCGECDGGVTELTLRYLGAEAANIVVKAGSEVVFQGDVQPNEQFGFVGVGSDLKLGKEIKVYIDGGQETKIHTSCSRPIGPGLVVGYFEVVDGYSLKGGRLCPMPECLDCDGGVTELTLRYLGAEAANIVVKAGSEVVFQGDVQPNEQFNFVGVGSDLKLGKEIKVYIDGSQETKIHTSCSRPIGPGLVVGYFEVVDGYSLKGGRLCPMPECLECKGGVTKLTLRYLGDSTAIVVVYEGKDPNPEKVLFSGMVAPGAEFTFTGIRSDLTMSSEISLWVDGQLHTKIHTSCSQPIGPGLISGDFEIIKAYSKDNGQICPLNVCSPNASAQLDFHDKEVRWKVTNAGDLGLEINCISISWPAANGFLNEIKRDRDTIHKGDFPAPSAVIDNGWEGDANKRTIKPGETDELKFKFQNDVSPVGPYSISVEFTSGCSIVIEIVP